MSAYERLFWIGCGMAAVLTASCMLLPWVVLGELRRVRRVSGPGAVKRKIAALNAAVLGACGGHE